MLDHVREHRSIDCAGRLNLHNRRRRIVAG
jgi:hypothetical protein